MSTLRILLTWNASARDPFFLALVAAVALLLTMLLLSKPRLYLPLILFTAPLPKLFTIASYNVEAAALTAAPGFSVVDIVLAAGIGALLLRRWRRPDARNARDFGRAMVLWSASVIFSVCIGLLLWPEVYKPIFIVYAVRYLLTLLSFGVAAQYAYAELKEVSLRKFLYSLAFVGNITILAGLVYYLAFGSAGGGTRGVNLLMGQDSSVALARTYFWFFDYANDMGFYAGLIAVLNIILLSDRRIVGLRLLTATGLLGCVATVLLIGERADLLVLAVSVGYFLWETSKLRHRSVRVSIVFQFICLIAIVMAFTATMSFLAPEAITLKFKHSVGESFDEGSSLAVMALAGVPQGIASSVASLPIGDFAGRLSLNIAGLWFFFSHPEGVGFWGELFAANFYSHHEFIKIAIEQGFPGIAALLLLLVRLKRLLWSGRNSPGAVGQLSVLLRSISVGLFAAMVMANTVLLDMKFMLVYWTLVGVWSVIPRGARVISPSATGSAWPQEVTVGV